MHWPPVGVWTWLLLLHCSVHQAGVFLSGWPIYGLGKGLALEPATCLPYSVACPHTSAAPGSMQAGLATAGMQQIRAGVQPCIRNLHHATPISLDC